MGENTTTESLGVALDSASVGEAARFRTLTELEELWAQRAPAPRDVGQVVLIVRRGEGGRRETPRQVSFSADEGLPGDAWSRKATPHPEAQLAVMQSDVAALIANGQPLTLFGDNLFVDLDLSEANLLPGSRVQVGEALLEVTPLPHNACRKFLSRFGPDALRFVSAQDQRHRNFRGIYMRVVVDGTVRPGDPVKVIERPSA